MNDYAAKPCRPPGSSRFLGDNWCDQSSKLMPLRSVLTPLILRDALWLRVGRRRSGTVAAH